LSLYAISDLHLSFGNDKPMDVFGPKWYKHHDNIKENWEANIREEDTVLIAGDISWSMKLEGSMQDLEYLNSLPGRKILVKGNHDYFWTSITKLNSLYDNMNFIQNNSFLYEDIAVCGTRGWTLPGSAAEFTGHDKKIYEREAIRLSNSLAEGKKIGGKDFIVMTHYPPFNDKQDDNLFLQILKEYNVKKCIYGHIHGEGIKNLHDEIDGIEFLLTSCDAINFNPIKIV